MACSDQSQYVINSKVDEFMDSNIRVNIHHPEAIFQPVFDDSIIPICDARLVDGGLELGFDSYEPLGSLGTSLRKTFIKTENVDTIVHDFVLQYLTAEPERAFLRFFDRIDDGLDFKTPDFIKTRGRKCYIMEFTTNRTSDETRLRHSYNIKHETYFDAIHNRRDQFKNIGYFIVVVGYKGVLSNIDFSQEEVDELCLRFRTINGVLQAIKRLGLTVKDDPEGDDLMKKVKANFEKVKFDWEGEDKKDDDDKLNYMDKEIYDSFFKPADAEYVKRIKEKTFREAYKKVKQEHFWSEDISVTKIENDGYIKYESDQQKANYKECDDLIKQYLNKAREGDRRFDNKSVVHAPYWIPMAMNETSDIVSSDNIAYKIEPIPLDADRDPMLELWRQAINCVNSGRVELFAEDLNKEIKKATHPQGNTSSTSKIKYHRIKPEISEEVRLHIAKVGVEAKSYLKKNNNSTSSEREEFREYRKEKRKPFSIDVDNDDLEQFLNNSLNWSKKTTTRCIMKDIQKRLIGSAYKLHEEKEYRKNLDFLDFFESTHLGRWSAFWSDVCTELSISLKQNCTPGEFVIKKVRSYNVLLLIKPTNQSGHIFFSLLAEKQFLEHFEESTVLAKFSSNEKYVWTEFKSYSAAKLVNGTKAEATCFSLFSYWHEFHKQPFWMQKDITIDVKRDIWLMTLLTTLISLNDKTKVEEHITLSRFIMMESFVNLPCIPKPQKMIEKLSIIPRSRLEVWFIKRQLELIERIADGFYFRLNVDEVDEDSEEVKEEGEYYWCNLYNHYTRKPLMDPHQQINLMYLGYLKNKEEPAEANTIADLYDKILIYENLLPKLKEFLGLNDPDKPEFHEYSRSLITEICNAGEEYLKSRLGEDFRTILEEEILKSLGNVNILKLSTLKASSTFSEKHYTPNTDEKEKISRCKVIEALSDYVKDEILLHELMPRVVKDLTKQGCMHIDLFKKPQHGGTREIYVLGIKERLGQCIIETIARCITSHFPSETMTHPNHKYSIPENHSKKAAGELGKHITVTTSDDAKKWNQGHFVTKFAHMLCRLTPKYMHPAIFKILRVWMKKRIMIDQRLLDIFTKFSTSTFTQETMNQMKEGFWGKLKNHWSKPNKRYIETTTGMMQGILHYTSSLFHTLYLTYLTNHIKFYIEDYMKKEGYNDKVVISFMQSSDDSAVMISFPNYDASAAGLMFQLTAIFFNWKKTFSPFFGIYDSIKSTTQTPYMVEFNSEFFFFNNLFRPTFRWLAAILTISEQEGIAQRQEEMSTLLTSLLEGGASYGLVGLAQLAQLMLHYRLLGLGVTSIASNYFDLVLTMPDPALGFFLLDNALCPGLAGFNYNLWIAVCKTRLRVKYKHLLEGNKENIKKKVIEKMEKRIEENKKEIENLRKLRPLRLDEVKVLKQIRERKTREHEVIDKGLNDIVDITTSGSFVQSTLILFGNRKKWKRLVEALKLPKNWLDDINQNPKVLYMNPDNPTSLKLRIAALVTSPGVTDSMSKGNSTSRMISAGVYSISGALSTTSSQMLSEEDEDAKEKNRTSLYFLAMRDNELGGEGLSDEEIRFLFPKSFEHEVLKASLDSVPLLTGIKIIERSRKVKTTINVTNMDDNEFPLESLVKWAWFGIDHISAANSVKREKWSSLKKVYKWLKDTPEETLNASPFSNHIQLQNFFSRSSISNRRVRLSGVPLKKDKENIISSLVKNKFNGFQCAMVIDETLRVASETFSELSQDIFMTLHYPYTDNRKMINVTNLIKDSPTINLTHGGAPGKRNNLSFIQKYLTTSDDKQIYQDLFHYKRGVLGFFDVKQSYIDEQWKGIFRWRGKVGETDVILEGIDEDVHVVTVNSLKFRVELNHLLGKLLKELGFNNFLDVHRHSAVRCHKNIILDSRELVGCPVYINKDIRMDLDFKSLGPLNFGFSRTTLRLFATYDRKEVTVLSVTIPQSCNPYGRKRVEEPIGSWLAIETLEPSTIASLINMSAASLFAYGIDMERMRMWLSELFYGALERVGVLKPKLQKEYTEVKDEMVVGQLENLMNVQSGAFNVSQYFIDSDDEDDEEEEGEEHDTDEGSRHNTSDEDSSDNGNQGGGGCLRPIPVKLEDWPNSDIAFRSAMPREIACKVRLAGHPLLDRYIQELMDFHGTRGLREMIRDFTYTSTDYLEEICYLANIDINIMRPKKRAGISPISPRIG